MKIKKNSEKTIEHFGQFSKISGIADCILDSIDESEDYSDIYEAIVSALDDELIYYADQWEVLRFYQTPQTANWDRAIDEFIDDLQCCVDEIENEEEKGA